LAIRTWEDVKRKIYGFKSFMDYFGKNKREIE